MVPGPRGWGARDRASWWLAAGYGAATAVAVADLAADKSDVLLPGVLAGPLLAAIGASTVGVAILSVYGIAIASLVAAIDGNIFSGRHAGQLGVIVVASVVAVVSTRLRESRDAELALTRPRARDAQRLRLALEAANMGTWRWDLRSGQVEWDDALLALYGLPAGGFDGAFETYASMLHPEDRERVLAAVREGMDRDMPWTFDHRVVWPDGSVHWLEGRGEPEHDEHGNIVGASGVSINVDERRSRSDAERAALARLRTLLVTSEQLGELDEPQRVVQTIAELAATRLGAWALVTRIGPTGELERVACAHRQDELVPLVLETMSHLSDNSASIRQVLNTGQPLVYNGLTEEARSQLAQSDELRDALDRIGYEGCLLVPITIAGRRLAVLVIGRDRPEPIDERDVELAIDLGRRGASALERAELWQASRAQLAAEHRTVELLQRTILPERLPEPEWGQFAAAYRPAETHVDVGGDWYDVFDAGDGSMMIVVGDVAGHGVQAASLMGRVRNALRAYAFEDCDPASVLTRLQRLLYANDTLEMVTAFVARFDPASRTLTWSRAGHPPPIVVHPDGKTQFLDDVNNAPLGTALRTYSSASVALQPQSILVCYTDGLIEQPGHVIDAGLSWLATRLGDYASSDLATLCDKLADDPFGPHPSPDDVCVLAMRILPS